MVQLSRSSTRHIASQPAGKLSFVVGVDLRVVPTARHCDIRQAAVDEFFSGLFHVHVNKHSVGSLSLAAMARHGIPVIEVRILLDVEPNGAARVQTKLDIALPVDFLDGR